MSNIMQYHDRFGRIDINEFPDKVRKWFGG